MFTQIVTVTGIGADGWPGLSPAAQQAIGQAAVIVGGPRQLALLPDAPPGKRLPLPSPLMPGLSGLITEYLGDGHLGDGPADGGPLVVLASGDPMFYGIGATLVRLLGPQRVRVLPHPSSVSLAAARLQQRGRRVLALTASETAAAEVRELLEERGFGSSPVTLLADLGAPDELVADVEANPGPHSRLAIVAVECRLDPAVTPLPRVPGLPDDAFEHDGQITKRELRALALAALAPGPGQLLWDVGAGSGSIGVEWMRVHPASRAIAVEPRSDRQARITRNASALGVPGLCVVAGAAPEALADLPAPDAVFIGGGVTVPGVVAACVAALGPGGRLVAHAVTIEGQAVLAEWRERAGGTLTRIGVERASPVGRFTAWRPALPVVQWWVQQAPVRDESQEKA